MKRLAIAFSIVVFAAALAPQALEAGVGIKGGYSLSKFAQIPAPDPGWDNSHFYVGGLSFGFGLGFVSFEPEILYVRMGGKMADVLEFRFQYIQVPVQIRLSIVPAGPVRPFISVGAYGSYLIKAEGFMTVGETTETTVLTADYQRYDYGAVGGAGLRFKLPGISLSVEGRYNYGLKNIMKDPAAGESRKNRCLMALVGIGF